MSTELNYWHFIVLRFLFLMFISGAVFILKQSKPKIIFPMLTTLLLTFVLISGFSIMVVDKYTKKVKLYKLENKRLLSIEKIIYSGIVKNEGSHTIGKVVFEIKLVNKGHVSGNVKSGSFFKPSGFFDFFSITSSGSSGAYKPQQITKKFVVARNLKPGEAKGFKVNFDYPPYFRNVSHFSKVYAH